VPRKKENIQGDNESKAIKEQREQDNMQRDPERDRQYSGGE